MNQEERHHVFIYLCPRGYELIDGIEIFLKIILNLFSKDPFTLLNIHNSSFFPNTGCENYKVGIELIITRYMRYVALKLIFNLFPCIQKSFLPRQNRQKLRFFPKNR